MRRENNARLRFLSRDEYKELSAIVLRDNPNQYPAFVVGIYTGMRWGEQFSLTWNQVDMRRKIIRLTQTKKMGPHETSLSIPSPWILFSTSNRKALTSLPTRYSG